MANMNKTTSCLKLDQGIKSFRTGRKPRRPRYNLENHQKGEARLLVNEKGG
jgi:hypothetical protein